jgi:hypothetical protein
VAVSSGPLIAMPEKPAPGTCPAGIEVVQDRPER